MLSYSSSSRIYRCPQCLTRITAPEIDENRVVCPACGTTRIISHKYFSLVACLVVIASYACSFLVVQWLTHDIRRFMLAALECAFVFLLVSARLLFPRLPLKVKPSATPKRIRRHFWHGFLVPRPNRAFLKSVVLTTTELKASRRKPALGEVVNFVYDAFRRNKIRFALTAAGIAVGTASLILVVTIGLTGRQYLLRLIQSIGSNEIWAEYESGAQRITSAPFDFLTLGDMQAVQTQVPGIVAATPVIKLGEHVPVRDGKERDILILGVYSDYWIVRNLVPVSGRFFDRQDEKDHSKACVITVTLARDLYGAPEQAIGRTIKLSGLPFTVIGIFKERVDTLGQTEIADDTMVIPYSASRYLSDTENVKMLYFSVAAPSMVVSATSKIRDVIVSRHRAESVYTVENLSQLVVLADRVTNTLTLILLAVAGVTLLVGGVGIMNIMLATVGARVQEVGIRKSVGATASDIQFQFLSEAIAISVGGGLVGVIVGLGVPFSLRLMTEYRIPVSGLSAIVGIVVSSLVGVLFGTFPAMRAARLNPIDSLRYE